VVRFGLVWFGSPLAKQGHRLPLICSVLAAPASGLLRFRGCWAAKGCYEGPAAAPARPRQTASGPPAAPTRFTPAGPPSLPSSPSPARPLAGYRRRFACRTAASSPQSLTGGAGLRGSCPSARLARGHHDAPRPSCSHGSGEGLLSQNGSLGDKMKGLPSRWIQPVGDAILLNFPPRLMLGQCPRRTQPDARVVFVGPPPSSPLQSSPE
jgi:hypothetical protein